MKPGLYFLEVWGAQGCNVTSTSILSFGGKGGYSSGTYVVNHSKKLYLHLGGTTNSTISIAASYNGGGAGANEHDGCGGGASDFRTSPGLWNRNFESRIIVAGGGGGAYALKMKSETGGRGGGLQGETDSTNCSPVGTQNGCSNKSSTDCGKLGIGATEFYGAGGGGKYGGGHCYGAGGGGGSGSIDGVTSHGKYEAYTGFSDHSGPGFASITAIVNFPVFTCRANGFTFAFNYNLVYYFVLLETGS